MMRAIRVATAVALVTLSGLIATAGPASAQVRARMPSPAPAAPDYAAHFRVFTSTGAPSSFEALVEAMAASEAVMVGEIHTDPVGHWVQGELLRAAIAGSGSSGRRVALSLEMFERDVQGVVNEYLLDLITEDQFRSASRPWPHYTADYRPLVETAKEAEIPVIAANAPRRYVNRVSRLGPDALGDLPLEALRSLPPLPDT